MEGLENSSMSGAHDNACPTDLFGSRYPKAVSRHDYCDGLIGLSPAAPSCGIQPGRLPPVPEDTGRARKFRIAESISSSVTVTPYLRVPLSPSVPLPSFQAPTEMLSAIVSAGPNHSFGILGYRLVYRLEPSAWTPVIFGILSMSPSSSRSRNPL